MCAHVYIRLHKNYIYVYMCIYIYVCIHIYVYICVCVCLKWMSPKRAKWIDPVVDPHFFAVLCLNMFAPTRTLLHTYNSHDHHHRRHHHHRHHHNITSSHHHIMIIITLNFATPSEQYVDWATGISYISMRDQNSPPPLNNMLIGVITSAISPWGIKSRHPLWTICWLG